MRSLDFTRQGHGIRRSLPCASLRPGDGTGVAAVGIGGRNGNLYGYLMVLSRRFASVDPGSSASARCTSARAADEFFKARYASARTTCAGAESSLQIEILSASTASAARPA